MVGKNTLPVATVVAHNRRMTNTTNTTTATVEVHRYSTGRRFFLVECHTCNTVLNSGHHYRPQDEALAQALADEHNATNHPTTTTKVADGRGGWVASKNHGTF